MPVSHIGLVVQDPVAAATFYTAALEPLGYRLFGTRDDQIGFGVKQADFFITPTKSPSAPLPIHIAFAAPSKLAVHESYAAAIRAGAKPTGAPAYRGSTDPVFNAAVIDIEGNTVEFIYRENASSNASVAPSTIVPIQRNHSPIRQRARHSPPHASQTIVRSNSQSRKRDRGARTPSSIRIPRETSRSPTASRRDTKLPTPPTSAKSLVTSLLGAAAGAVAVYAAILTDGEKPRRGSASSEPKPKRSERLSRSKTDYDTPSSPVRTRRAATFDEYSSRGKDETARRERYGEHVRRDSAFSGSSRRPSMPVRQPSQRQTSQASASRESWIDGRGDAVWSTETQNLASHGMRRRNSDAPPGFANTAAYQARPRRYSTAGIDPRSLPRGMTGHQTSGIPPVTLDMIDQAAGVFKRTTYADDLDTVAPEDSISCVGVSQQRARRGTGTFEDRHRSGRVR